MDTIKLTERLYSEFGSLNKPFYVIIEDTTLRVRIGDISAGIHNFQMCTEEHIIKTIRSTFITESTDSRVLLNE